MSIKPTRVRSHRPRFRADRVESQGMLPLMATLAVLLVAGVGFVLIGGGARELSATEARLGMAAAEPIGPYGQLFGAWDPLLWPGKVIAAWGWSQLEDSHWPTHGSVRWPSVIACLIAGWLLSRRAAGYAGLGAGAWVGVCWFGSLAIIDHSAELNVSFLVGMPLLPTITGPDALTGLALIAALDRILGRGTDLVAGLWAALALIVGGWTTMAVLGLAVFVLGRRNAWWSWRFLLPPLITAGLWSVWAASIKQPEAFAAALLMPLKLPPQWSLVPELLLWAWPWSPLAVLALLPSVRNSWPTALRGWILGWMQIGIACAIVGTIIPGLAGAARMPALAALILVCAACAHQLWNYERITKDVSPDRPAEPETPRRMGDMGLGIVTLIVVLHVVVVIPMAFRLCFMVPYYRALSIVLLVAAGVTACVNIGAVARGRMRWGLIAIVLVAVGLKLTHWGYYVPEWNYRLSQGPWGRAIGQWVPPRSPIYFIDTHAPKWSPDLAFAAQRPFRQLPTPQMLNHLPGKMPKFVLLHPSEFANWPDDAPKLIKVFDFYDAVGWSVARTLARTEGDPDWRLSPPDLD